LQRHKQNGFKNHIDLFILYFETGQDALNLETEIKRKLTKIGIPSVKEDKELKTSFDGYTESFRTELLPSKDLKDLLKKLNLDIPKDIKHAWVPTPS
jgi:hypothetical protein